MTEEQNKPESTEETAETSTAPNSSNGAESESAADDDGEVVIDEVDPVEAAQAEAAQFKEKMLRTAADFDNFRKRTRREISDAEKKGRELLLKDILPVFDNLERATSHASDGGEDLEKAWKGLSDGINLVVRQFRDTLGRLGIERVDSVGQPFDPSVHEAIQHLETDEHPPGAVAAEAQAAYREGDRLIRPALVVVAKAPPAPATEPDPGTDDQAAGAADEESPSSSEQPSEDSNQS